MSRSMAVNHPSTRLATRSRVTGIKGIMKKLFVLLSVCSLLNSYPARISRPVPSRCKTVPYLRDWISIGGIENFRKTPANLLYAKVEVAGSVEYWRCMNHEEAQQLSENLHLIVGFARNSGVTWFYKMTE